MKAILIILCAICLTSHAQAQFNASGSGIGLSYSILPNRDFKDTTGKFGYAAYGINAHVPLFGNRSKIKDEIMSGEMPHFYETSLHASFESLPFTIGFITPSHQVYNGSAGLGLIFNSKKNIFIANAGIGIAADDQVIKNNDTRYRFSGAFIVNNRHSSTTTYMYGIVFTYAYGRPLPLPVLGIHKKFSATSKWSISGILPVSVQLNDKISKAQRLSFFVRPAGNRFQFSNQGSLPTTSSYAYMQVRQFQLGSSYNYKFSKSFSFNADAALLFGGSLKFTEESDTKTVLSQATIKPGPSLKIGIRYNFSKKRNNNNDDFMSGGF